MYFFFLLNFFSSGFHFFLKKCNNWKHCHRITFGFHLALLSSLIGLNRSGIHLSVYNDIHFYLLRAFFLNFFPSFSCFANKITYFHWNKWRKNLALNIVCGLFAFSFYFRFKYLYCCYYFYYYLKNMFAFRSIGVLRPPFRLIHFLAYSKLYARGVLILWKQSFLS